MFLGTLVMITALSISAVAIYYSVAGLVAIFAAAAVPIIIMGSVLEIGKLVTTVWLHKYWNQATWWLKTYLSAAVVVLMFITSMGIFGFLSKAHIEQTSNAMEGIAQIEQIDSELARQENIINKARDEISAIESSGNTQDNIIQEQIDREQSRIDTAYERIQPAIDEQLLVIKKSEADIETRVAEFESQVLAINQKLSNLSTALFENNVRTAQSIVGLKQDGSLGPATSAAIQRFRNSEESKRDQLLERIDEIRTAVNPSVDAARAEISRLRSITEQQISNSDELISRLRSQLGSVDVAAIDVKIQDQEKKLAEATVIVNTLTEQKYLLEAEYRKLEAEVGPLKYLAEFIYGDSADNDLLEESVRWVIITIIFVFDPLAVLLLIASQYTLEVARKEEVQKKLPAKKRQSKAVSKNLNKKTTPPKPATDKNINDATKTVDQVYESLKPEDIEEIENSEEFKIAKQKWKEQNPDKTIKQFKDDYIKGKINNLPWGIYVQNGEQKPDSIWQRIRNSK